MLISTTVLWLILFYSDWLQKKKSYFVLCQRSFLLFSYFLYFYFSRSEYFFQCQRILLHETYNLFVPANSDLSETEYEVDLNSLEISQVLKRQKKKNSTIATESQLPQVKALMEKFIFIPLLVNF